MSSSGESNIQESWLPHKQGNVRVKGRKPESVGAPEPGKSPDIMMIPASGTTEQKPLDILTDGSGGPSAPAGSKK
jgi:hypothetical protein